VFNNFVILTLNEVKGKDLLFDRSPEKLAGIEKAGPSLRSG
jgi:hypothetical protein